MQIIIRTRLEYLYQTISKIIQIQNSCYNKVNINDLFGRAAILTLHIIFRVSSESLLCFLGVDGTFECLRLSTLTEESILFVVFLFVLDSMRLTTFNETENASSV